MKIGLTTYNVHALEFQELARAADAAGFDSLWLGEHVVLPSGYSTAHPTTRQGSEQHHTGPIIDPATELVDPLVQLGAAAAVTARIRLATGVYILPLRHPLATAARRAPCRSLRRVGLCWASAVVGSPKSSPRSTNPLRSVSVGSRSRSRFCAPPGVAGR